MQVEVRVVQGFKDGAINRYLGMTYVTDQLTAARLQAEGKIKVLREVPSHTQKKDVSHTPKKRY